MERWQILAARLGDHPKLIVGYHLEHRFGQQAQALDLLRRRATALGLVLFPHRIDGLLNQRLAGLDHANKATLVHRLSSSYDLHTETRMASESTSNPDKP